MHADHHDEHDAEREPAEEQAPAPEKTDREEGGPTSANDPGEEPATGAGHGTREAPFDPHE